MHAHVQRLVLVVKMVTMLEECTNENQCSIVRFLWAKGLNAKDIHKEMFLLMMGSVRHMKWFTTVVANISLMTKRLKRRCRSG
jgi:hypothetical protein